MPSYLITGANRGIGHEFVRQLSQDSKNVVIGTVRDKKNTIDTLAAQFGRNVHWVEADLDDRTTIKRAMAEVSAITDGKLDVLIANAARLPEAIDTETMFEHATTNPEKLENDLKMQFQTNVIGQIFLLAEAVPLLRAGSVKKAIGISSGNADEDLVRDFDIDFTGPYAIAKAGFNMAFAKFHAEFGRKEGILFMTVSPGNVDTDKGLDDPEIARKWGPKFQKFLKYQPNFRGPMPVDQAVGLMLGVVSKATVETHGGRMVSHNNDRMWL